MTDPVTQTIVFTLTCQGIKRFVQRYVAQAIVMGFRMWRLYEDGRGSKQQQQALKRQRMRYPTAEFENSLPFGRSLFSFPVPL